MLRLLPVLAVAAAQCVFDPLAPSPFAGLAPYTPTHAKSFSIRYTPTFKVLNVSLGGTNYITTVSLCGAPLPPAAAVQLGPSDQLLSQLSQPLTRLAITSTTYAPYLDLTGHLAQVAVVAGASSFVSPCIRASALSGAITDIGDFSAFTPASAAAQATQAVLGGQWSDATFGGKKVLLAEDTETTALGVGEYAVYVAALFNDEARAAAAFADIAARSACTAAAASAALAPARPGATPPAAPRVLWGSPYPAFPADQRTWYVAACPNWYCGLVAGAGGALLTSAAGSALTDSQFAALAAQADVFVYTGIDFEASQRAYLPGAAAPLPNGADPALAAIYATMPAVASGRVFDILGQAGGNAWFQLRPLNSEALLQELLRALHPVAAAAGGFVAQPVRFLRNVFSGSAPEALVAAATCPRGVAGAPPSTLLSAPCPTRGAAAGAAPTDLTGGPIAGIVLAALVLGCVLVLFASKAGYFAACAGAGAAAGAAKPAAAAPVQAVLSTTAPAEQAAAGAAV